MIADIWTFLHNADNRAILGWLGSGVAVLAGAVWAIWKFAYSKRCETGPSIPTVQATGGGVAAGRDIRESKVEIRRGTGH